MGWVRMAALLRRRVVRSCVLILSLLLGQAASAATDWNTRDYDLYPGDFDGDGKTDLLYIAKDASKASGIARSDGSGPNIPWQSWPSNYLGIPWSGQISKPVVADFNADGKADIFLQRLTSGDHYLLLANAQGKIADVHQSVANSHLSLSWSGADHALAAGDFNGDGRADLFLQATQPSGISAVVLADDDSKLTIRNDWWTNGHLGLKWSTRDAFVYVGNFNGTDSDGKRRADLLVQARPTFALIDFDVSIPVPTFAPNMNAIVLARPVAAVTEPIFDLSGVRAWSRKALGADWSPLAFDVVIGDFNGDGIADVLLQPHSSAQPAYLVPGSSSGFPLGTASALANNIPWASSSYRLIAGNFDGTGSTGVYFQATDSSGSNAVANTVTGASVSTVAHNPTAATGVLPVTAVGHTVGSFNVTTAGSATYSVPISVPPGVAGIQPQLAVNYDSGAGNGLLGVGWSLSGFSEIERCAKTPAQDSSSDGVLLTLADRYCLDGNKLRLTGGTYGYPNSTYQTENETFAKITANGAAGDGPASFTVETKDGLRMEYGFTADSRIEAVNTTSATTAHTWALNKVSDPHGNTMTITYEEDGAPNGSYRPLEMLYTSNANASLSASYKVRFEWAARPAKDVPFQYIAGSATKETKRLDRIETRYYDQGTWRLVRQYRLSYNAAGATPRSRLASIQECDGAGACLAPTMVSWYDGAAGWENEYRSTATNSSAVLEAAYALDLDGDARTDLVYPQTSGSTAYWYSMRAAGNGYYGAPAATSFVPGSMAVPYSALAIDYSGTGRQGLLTAISGNSTLQILEWNAASNTLVKTPTNISGTLNGKEWVGDFTGDGRPDYVYSSKVGTTVTFYLRANIGMSGGVAQFAAETVMHSMTLGGEAEAATTREADFNGDGRSDLLVRSKYNECEEGSCTPWVTWYVMRSNGSTLTSVFSTECEGTNCGQSIPVVADFNGDGFSDFLVLSGTPTQRRNTLYYGHSLGISTGPTISSLNAPQLPLDYDGDGDMDLIYPVAGVWRVMVSSETGVDGYIDTNISAAVPNAGRVVDIDGDGQMDVGYKDGTFMVRRHRGVSEADLLRSVADGYGNVVSVSYGLLTDSDIYTKASDAQFPVVDVMAPMQVVKSYTANDGIGGTYTVTERYANARAHVQGRGFLGFGVRTTTDGLTGIKTVTTYRQDYPYVGFVAQESVYQPNGTTLISETTNTPQTLETSSTDYQQRHYPYIKTSVQKSYEVGGVSDGQQIAEVTTTNTIDDYGNPTSIETSTIDKTGTNLSYSSIVSNLYDNDDPYCLWRGFIYRQSISKTVPVYGTETRTVEFVKDTTMPLACRPHQEIVEPTDATGKLKVITTLGYDAFGHPTTQTVEAANVPARTSTTSYGDRGVFPVSVTNSLNQSASKTYDYALGVAKTATDPNNLQVVWDYDGFGRMTLETRPDQTKTSYVYSPCNSGNSYCGDSRLRYQVEKRELDAANGIIRVTRQLLDAFSRPVYDQAQTLSGAMATVATNYDNQGRAYQQSQPYFPGFPAYFSTTTYDLIGRPTQDSRRISEADTGTQTTLYSYNRRFHSVTDANGKVTQQEMNVVGQVIKMIDSGGGTTQYEYDPFGNLKTTVDPLGNQIVHTYNKRGFKTQTKDPDMGEWNYTYYPTGELRTQTDANNKVVTFTYDALGRPYTRSEEEGVTTFNYGTSAAAFNIGKLQSITLPNVYTESFAYDSKGRVQTSTVDLAGGGSYVTSSDYNSSTGLLESITYPTSTPAVPNSRFKVKYEYEYGLPKRVRDFNAPSTVYWEQVATNAAGQAIDEAYGNGLHSYSNYDAITGLLSTRTAGSSSQVQNLAYKWDKVGNLLQRNDLRLGFAEDFYYDQLYRLKCSTFNVARQSDCNQLTTAQKNLDMTYDVLGNITGKSGVGAYSYPQSGSASVRPHAVTSAGGSSYGYDNNGNMITRGGSAITWYSYNLPKKINKGGNSTEFFYTPTRARYKQVSTTTTGPMPSGTETTIYIAGLYEQVTKPSGTIEHKHYIVAGGEAIAIRTLRSNGTDETNYLHKDHLGSVDVITNQSGSVVQRLSFDAFGKRRSAISWSGEPSATEWLSVANLTHLGFTSHEQLDNVDLIHMNGRVYDPNLGRFISADPFIQAPLMSQSFNRYSYVMNNPLSLIDPSGYSSLSSLRKKVHRHLSATVRFLVKPTPRNFFETIRSLPNQDKIDRYIMTHEWAYKAGYAIAVVASWWIGGYGGAVYQAYYTYIATGSATAAVKVGIIAAAKQFAANYYGTGSGFSIPTDVSSGIVVLSFDSAAGAAGGSNFLTWFLLMAAAAPDAPAQTSKAADEQLGTVTSRGYDSMDAAVKAWAPIASSITAKYRVEIGAGIYRSEGKYWLSKPVVGNTVCTGDVECSVNIRLARSPIAGALQVGYVHAHPDNSSFSQADLGMVYSISTTEGGPQRGYVVQANGRIWAWSTDIIRRHPQPGAKDWTPYMKYSRQVQ